MDDAIKIPDRAFTLIELLVVITIIVVLIALLAPGLDKAVYQAELAVCGARLDAVGLGVSTYALDHARAFPRRVTAVGQLRPMMLNYSGPTAGRLDDRPPLEGYIMLPTLVDSMVDPIELGPDANGAETAIYSSYALWFGWRIADTVRSRGLMRLGDRLSYFDGVRSHAFDILASDADSVETGWGFSQASHPDPGGPRLATIRNERAFNPAQGAYTYSFWTHDNSRNKGPIDRQFLAVDGSVERLNALTIKANGDPDERLIAIPGVADPATNARLKEHLPAY